ncbi:hypothetical protein I5M32_09465 [Pedobacter sp. SD-b]|uniref:Uncharacterized protein n=1 Tax=Pedobacter segetis TaxID=2793069 RepID=A0ABS1BJX5_9SPHI|nr:hypothetical protein [Pedobacter segetis]MBK0383185.1 hypothetical protein [Pedobacter segetis]
MRYVFLVFILIISLSAKAQKHFQLKVYDHKKLENQTLKIFSENGIISLRALKPNVIKVGFSSLPDLDPKPKQNNGVYVRVTQNLDDVFMQTDSLLIIINKLNFSIKYKSLKEKLYTINTFDNLSGSDKNLVFLTAEDEVLSYSKNKSIKEGINKNISLNVCSSKGYAIVLDKKQQDLLKSIELDHKILKIYNSDKSKMIGYTFIAEHKNKIRAVLKGLK